VANNTNTNADDAADAADAADTGASAVDADAADVADADASAMAMAAPAGSIPVTVMGNLGQAFAGIRIGTQQMIWPNNAPLNSTWFVVVDLTYLQVVANVVSTSTTQVPPALGPYIANPGFMLIAVSLGWTFDHVPQGALYSFLRSTGSGAALERAEQIYAQLGTGYFSSLGYILAATLDSSDGSGIEEFGYMGPIPIMTFSLLPVTVGGKTTYTPIKTWR
jgi:hypothetical protein